MKKRITSNKFDSKSIGVFSRNDLKTIKGQIIYWIFFSILVVVSVISVVPAIWTIFTAFKDTQDIYNSISFFPRDLSWNRIVGRISESWAQLQLGRSIINTFLLSFGNLLVRIIVCGLGRICFVKIETKGHKTYIYAGSMDHDDACSDTNGTDIYVISAFPICIR